MLLFLSCAYTRTLFICLAGNSYVCTDSEIHLAQSEFDKEINKFEGYDEVMVSIHYMRYYMDFSNFKIPNVYIRSVLNPFLTLQKFSKPLDFDMNVEIKGCRIYFENTNCPRLKLTIDLTGLSSVLEVPQHTTVICEQVQQFICNQDGTTITTVDRKYNHKFSNNFVYSIISGNKVDIEVNVRYVSYSFDLTHFSGESVSIMTFSGIGMDKKIIKLPDVVNFKIEYTPIHFYQTFDVCLGNDEECSFFPEAKSRALEPKGVKIIDVCVLPSYEHIVIGEDFHEMCIRIFSYTSDTFKLDVNSPTTVIQLNNIHAKTTGYSFIAQGLDLVNSYYDNDATGTRTLIGKSIIIDSTSLFGSLRKTYYNTLDIYVDDLREIYFDQSFIQLRAPFRVRDYNFIDFANREVTIHVTSGNFVLNTPTGSTPTFVIKTDAYVQSTITFRNPTLWSPFLMAIGRYIDIQGNVASNMMLPSVGIAYLLFNGELNPDITPFFQNQVCYSDVESGSCSCKAFNTTFINTIENVNEEYRGKTAMIRVMHGYHFINITELRDIKSIMFLGANGIDKYPFLFVQAEDISYNISFLYLKFGLRSSFGIHIPYFSALRTYTTEISGISADSMMLVLDDEYDFNIFSLPSKLQELSIVLTDDEEIEVSSRGLIFNHGNSLLEYKFIPSHFILSIKGGNISLQNGGFILPVSITVELSLKGEFSISGFWDYLSFEPSCELIIDPILGGRYTGPVFVYPWFRLTTTQRNTTDVSLCLSSTEQGSHSCAEFKSQFTLNSLLEAEEYPGRELTIAICGMLPLEFPISKLHHDKLDKIRFYSPTHKFFSVVRLDTANIPFHIEVENTSLMFTGSNGLIESVDIISGSLEMIQSEDIHVKRLFYLINGGTDDARFLSYADKAIIYTNQGISQVAFGKNYWRITCRDHTYRKVNYHPNLYLELEQTTFLSLSKEDNKQVHGLTLIGPNTNSDIMLYFEGSWKSTSLIDGEYIRCHDTNDVYLVRGLDKNYPTWLSINGIRDYPTDTPTTMMELAIETSVPSVPLKTGTLIAITVVSAAILIAICITVLLLYRKHLREKTLDFSSSTILLPL